MRIYGSPLRVTILESPLRKHYEVAYMASCVEKALAKNRLLYVRLPLERNVK
jgi:hypothetical protein